jgi:hypothetical protein
MSDRMHDWEVQDQVEARQAPQFPMADPKKAVLRKLGLEYLAAMEGLLPSQWTKDPQVIATEKALLDVMIKTPEKALVVGSWVIAVIIQPDGYSLGVWEM